jgi:hypothetical protein
MVMVMVRLKMNKILSKASFILILFSSVVNAQGLPQLPVLEAADDLDSVLSGYTLELQLFMDSNGSDYSFAYGVGAVAVNDKTSGQYLNSINLAYKQGLLNAYKELASTLDPSGIQITTDDVNDINLASGNVLKDKIISQCKSEANIKYIVHKKKLEEETTLQKEEKGSLLGLVKNKLKSDEQLAQERIKEQEERSKPEPDFIHNCSAPGNTFVQSSSTTSSVSDTLNGGRIWATVYHDGNVGVVVAKSSESTVIAAVLKEQFMPASINRGALLEIRNRVKEEVGKFPEFPFGLVGTRMMRLSNGEWALYSYGATQDTGNNSSGLMDNVASGMSKSGANQQALSELSRFSGLVVNATSASRQTSAVKQTYTVEVNTTKDTAKLKVDQEQTLGEVLNVSFSGSSNLTLVGSREVLSKKFETSDGLAFRLSAIAWSPSVMAGNMAKREQYNNATENAVREAEYKSKGASAAKSGKGTSKAIISDQDW